MGVLTERELDGIIAAAQQAKRDAAYREFARDIIQQIVAQAAARSVVSAAGLAHLGIGLRKGT